MERAAVVLVGVVVIAAAMRERGSRDIVAAVWLWVWVCGGTAALDIGAAKRFVLVCADKSSRL